MCIYEYIYTPIHTYIFVCIHVYIYIFICAYVYIYRLMAVAALGALREGGEAHGKHI